MSIEQKEAMDYTNFTERTVTYTDIQFWSAHEERWSESVFGPMSEAQMFKMVETLGGDPTPEPDDLGQGMTGLRHKVLFHTDKSHIRATRTVDEGTLYGDIQRFNDWLKQEFEALPVPADAVTDILEMLLVHDRSRRDAQAPDGYCRHGVYVGGIGIDWMCQACEMGSE